MSDWRFKVVYRVLFPALTIAAGVLAYYTYQTASQVERLGEESIAQSTLFLVEDKVDRVEQQLIESDNAVFRGVDLAAPQASLATWKQHAEERTPSVRSVLVLDDTGSVAAYEARASEKSKRDFLKIFLGRIVGDLELERLEPNRLKHLHRSYANRSYLLAYKAVRHRGHRYSLVALHDTGHIVRELFPSVLANERGKQLYNVVDERNHRVFGPSLARAGDYVVGRRFPSTLYEWRLQVAPKAAPLLQAKGRTRRYNEVALIGLSLAVILVGALFLLYAADKERRLNALKSDFIANVSHELKTPLSVVRMFTELLLTKRVRDERKQQQYLELIGSESERLTGLIENVLDFAALERGKRRYQMELCAVDALVEQAAESFRPRIDPQDCSLCISHVGPPAHVRVDQQAITLALINLLDNAAKYGGTGPVEITVESRARWVDVRVRDHGPGIAAEDLRRVFERFYRARRDPTTRGSGIGLSLVKHIAEDHGGRAWAENAEDGGAILTMRLPRARRADTTRTRDASEAAADASRDRLTAT